MAPQKGGSVKPADTDEVEEVPASIPRGQGGRPKIWKLVPHPDDPFAGPVESRDQTITMTRASSLGDALENKYLIHRWDMRNLAFALSRRPDLVLQLAAIPDIEEKANKNEVHDVVRVALDFAGGTAAATSGSAIHRLSERLDAGEDLSYLPEAVLDALAVYRRLMSIVRIVASETFVVCDELGAAGTYDRVVELLNDTEVRWRDAHGVEQVTVLTAGTRLILDLKTSATAMYFGAVYACQEAVYGYGVPYTHEGGRGTWPDGLAPSREWGLLLHLPIDSLADAGFYWVDLRQGYDLALQAAAHREAMKAKDLFWPTNLDPIPIPVPAAPVESCETAEDADEFDLLAAIVRVQDEAELTALWKAHDQEWTDEHSAAAKVRMHELVPGHPENTLAEATGTPTDLLTTEEIEVEVPAQVARTRLIGELRAASSEAQLNALWEANQEIWSRECTTMVRARLRELAVSP